MTEEPVNIDQNDSSSSASDSVADTTVQEIDKKVDETQTLLNESRDEVQHEHGLRSSEHALNERRVSVRYAENVLSNQLMHCEKVTTNFLASAFGSVTTIKSVGKKQTVNCRTVLWFLAFFGFMINYMYRININIAIVEMVTARKSSTISHLSECIPPLLDADNSTVLEFTTSKSVHHDDSIHFAWNELEQSRVIGSFFWLHWVLQVVGGILAPRFGTKLIFGLSNFLASFLCIFIPIAAKYHADALIALRVVQGFISALAWPSMHHLTAQWIPPDERSKFITSYLGSSVGIALFYPLFGYVMSLWSWEAVFYLSAAFGTFWYAAWLYFVYDSPVQHPRIDRMEQIYIEKSLGDTLHDKNEKRVIPWSQILRSRPVWVNIVGQFGGVWGLFTMMAQAPTYFRVILGWNVQMTGLLSGIPHLTRMIFAYGFSMFADSLLRNKRLSRTNVRKLAGATCTLVNGAFVVCLAYSGCDSGAAIIFLTLSTAVHGAVSSGQLASLIDISPNYSSITLGLNGFFAVWPGFISPYIVGKLTLGNQTVQQWQYIFLITAGILFITGTIYVLFADSSLQDWNQPGSKDKGEEFDEKTRSQQTNDVEKAEKLKHSEI